MTTTMEQTVKDMKKEIYLMIHKAQTMLELTEDGFMKSKVSALDEADSLAREIQSKEDALTAALARMSPGDSAARSILSVPSHVEKIATCIGRISDNSRTRIKDGLLFSDKAIAETSRLFDLTRDILKKTGDAAVSGTQATVSTAIAETDRLERMANEYATAHEERLVTGECSPKSSSNYLCILYAFDDIGAYIRETLNKFTAK